MKNQAVKTEIELTKEEKAVLWFKLKGIKVRSSEIISVVISSDNSEYFLELSQDEIEYRASLWDDIQYIERVYQY